MASKIRSFFNDESGATAIEYSLLTGIICVGVIAAVSDLSAVATSMYERIAARLASVAG